MRYLESILRARHYATRAVWEIERLRNSDDLCRHLPDLAQNCDQTLYKQDDITRPLAVISCTSLNFKNPIDEILLARFPNHILSAAIFARAAVSNQLLTLANSEDIKPYGYSDSLLDDDRDRVALSVDLTIPREVKRIEKLFKIANQLSPFNVEVKSIIKLLTYKRDDEVEECLTLPINTDIYPPYFEYSPRIFSLMNVQCYNPAMDAVIPTTLTPFQLAILDGDLQKMEELLNFEPLAVLQRDPWGREPFELAIQTGKIALIKFVIRQRSQVVDSHCKLQQKLERTLKNHENNKIPDLPSDVLDFLKKDEIQYLNETVVPQRSRGQQACVDGDLSVVLEEYSDKKQLETPDPLGYKPIFLSVANNHIDIVLTLLKLGASPDFYIDRHIRHGQLGFYLTDQVRSPEMMKTLLYHCVGSSELQRALTKAVIRNHTAIVEVLLFYLRDINQKIGGLRPFDIILKYSPESNRVAMLSLFSQYWEDYFPDGPYNDSIPQNLEKILKAHNNRQNQTEISNEAKPTVEKVAIAGERLMTTLKCSDNRELTIITKPIRAMSLQEKVDCYRIFDANFALASMQSDKQDKFHWFYKTVSCARHEFAYIDICYDKDKVIGFLIFEFRPAKKPYTQEFLVFHAELGCYHRDYQKMGLSNLAFRSLIAATRSRKFHHVMDPTSNKILLYAECIKPGLGFSIFPKYFKGHPTHRLPDHLLEHVFDLTKTKSNPDKTIESSIIAYSDRTPHGFKFSKYHFFSQKRVTSSIPICGFVTEEVVSDFMKQMQANDVTERNLEPFFQYWHLKLTQDRIKASWPFCALSEYDFHDNNSVKFKH